MARRFEGPAVLFCHNLKRCHDKEGILATLCQLIGAETESANSISLLNMLLKPEPSKKV